MTTTGSDPAASPLCLRLFGPFELRRHGELIPRVRVRHGHWLLALLALRHPHPVERAWLAGTLWPDSPQPLAFRSLRSTLAELRLALGAEASRLRSPTVDTLCLDLFGATVDLFAFDAALLRGDAASLEEAVGLYRGPLLEECGEAWIMADREAREHGYLGALERLAAEAVAGGEATSAERRLRAAVAVDPLRESAQRALMEALAAGGSYAAALEVYREIRLLLHRELSAEPDPETQALFQQIQAEARSKAALGYGLWALSKGASSPLGDRSAAVLTQSPEPRAGA